MMSELQSRLANKGLKKTKPAPARKKDSHTELMDQIKGSARRLRKMTLSFEPKRPKNADAPETIAEEPAETASPSVTSLVEKMNMIRQAQHYDSDDDESEFSD